MLDSALQSASALIASEEAGFVQDTLLYVAGGLLVLVALGLAFYGMRREDDFPSSKAVQGLIGLTAVLVVITAYGAVENARFEQSERRAENREAAAEEQAVEAENEAAQGPMGEGEAAPEPPTATPEGGEEGRQVFDQTGCGSCHTLADAGSEGVTGPVLDEVLPGQDPEMIRTSIIDPSAEVSEGFPANTMPDNYETLLDEAELDALVQYLVNVAGEETAE